jgi:hypothetical protein
VTAEGWRHAVEQAQDDEKMRELLVRLLTEQDAAKNLLQKRFACTGRPWPDLVADVFEHVEEREREIDLTVAAWEELRERLDRLEHCREELHERLDQVEHRMDAALAQGEIDDDGPEEDDDMANHDDDEAAKREQAEHHFPNVECPKHPGWRAPGFCVCVHVLDANAPIAHYHDATPRQLGEVLCENCITDVDAVRPEGLRLICAHCVEQLLASRAPDEGTA